MHHHAESQLIKRSNPDQVGLETHSGMQNPVFWNTCLDILRLFCLTPKTAVRAEGKSDRLLVQPLVSNLVRAGDDERCTDNK